MHESEYFERIESALYHLLKANKELKHLDYIEVCDYLDKLISRLRKEHPSITLKP